MFVQIKIIVDFKSILYCLHGRVDPVNMPFNNHVRTATQATLQVHHIRTDTYIHVIKQL